jgi:hypothetical protein
MQFIRIYSVVRKKQNCGVWTFGEAEVRKKPLRENCAGPRTHPSSGIRDGCRLEPPSGLKIQVEDILSFSNRSGVWKIFSRDHEVHFAQPLDVRYCVHLYLGKRYSPE